MFSESILQILSYQCAIHPDDTRYSIDMEQGMVTDCCCEDCQTEMTLLLQLGMKMDGIMAGQLPVSCA